MKPLNAKAKRLVKLLTGAGLKPRSYSGRYMYGAHCVGVSLNSAGDMIDIPKECGKPAIDQLGLDIIAYWPNAEVSTR